MSGPTGSDLCNRLVDTDEHLARGFTYIDLNMVRAGVVDHPRQGPESGYREIQNRPERYRIIDRAALYELLAVEDSRLAEVQNEWIEAKLMRARAGGAVERGDRGGAAIVSR